MNADFPKIAFSFWEGSQFTYLHALTVITFQKFNPDFKIKIYVSRVENSDLIKWSTGEHSKQYSNLYDINLLKNIPNVELIDIDVNKELNYDGVLSCVWKSDIIRLMKLHEHGGMYIDLDILFIKKIPDSLFEIDKLMFNTYYGVINNAVIISRKENYIIKKIIDVIFEMLKTNNVKNEYMQFGPTLITNIIKNTSFEEDVYYIPNDMTCPYLCSENEKLFFSNEDQTTKDTFALHWYNGGEHSRNYCSNFDINNINSDRCIFEKLLSEIVKVNIDKNFKTICQKCKLIQPEYVVEMVKKYSPGWEYKQYINGEEEKYFVENPIEDFPLILEKFNSIENGCHRADLFRYWYLYTNGGFILDSDAMIYDNIDNIIKDYDFVSVESVMKNTICNGIIFCKEKSPIIYETIRLIYNMDVHLLNHNFHYLCYQLYDIIQSKKDSCNIKLYKEKHNTNVDAGVVTDDDGNEIIKHYFKYKVIPN